MYAFIVNSDLTVIRSVDSAKKVIESITKDNELRVEIGDGNLMIFEYTEESHVGSKESGISIRTVNKDSTPFNIIDIVYDKDTASRRLYAIRKAYNNMWKD